MDWIPVTEALPDDGLTVLVFAPEASEPVWLAFLDGDEGWRYVDALAAPGVTHWMDLPEGAETQPAKPEMDGKVAWWELALAGAMGGAVVVGAVLGVYHGVSRALQWAFG